MRILMVLEHSFPPDIRVEKEARSLIEAGHEVTVICPAAQEQPEPEVVEGTKVLRLRIPSAFVHRAWRFGWSALSVNPFWKKHLEKAITQENIEALHIHDLPLVKTGLAVARRHSIPLVADLHEIWPLGVREWSSHRGWPNSIKRRITNTIMRWEKVEGHCVRAANRVVTIIDEAKEYYVDRYSISPDKVVVVMNTEDPNHICSMPLDQEIVSRCQDYFTICYVGGFGEHRGIQTVIKAMPGILTVVPKVRLVLVGSGGNEAQLRQMAKELGVDGAVEFVGQQPFAAVPSFIEASQACLVPYSVTPHTDRSCPHKLFQYMAMGKPVIVSSMKSLSRIISETGAGLVYRADDPGSLSESVVMLHRDPALAARLGQSGRDAVKQQYGWQNQSDRLLALYEELR